MGKNKKYSNPKISKDSHREYVRRSNYIVWRYCYIQSHFRHYVEINGHLHALASAPCGEATVCSQAKRLDGPQGRSEVLLRNNARSNEICPSLRTSCLQPFLYYLRHSIFTCFVFTSIHLMHHITHICYSHWFHYVSLFCTKPQDTLDTAVLCTDLVMCKSSVRTSNVAL
jgi:hypothetical protein